MARSIIRLSAAVMVVALALLNSQVDAAPIAVPAVGLPNLPQVQKPDVTLPVAPELVPGLVRRNVVDTAKNTAAPIVGTAKNTAGPV
ncbi:hypothetical protein BGZ49_001331, partial [Haplosporangium sp. Z 27]